jgi:dephospho-CoA kinase
VSAFTVGLTGGLASGKSTVARWLAEAGFTVHDADRWVAEMYRPGEVGAKAVAALFGEEVLLPDGSVDRKKVADRVFANPEARRALEAAIHPLVEQRYVELAEKTPGVVVFEATLMVESGSSKAFDLVVSVEADPELRLARAIERGMDEASARARLEAQGDGAVRLAGAHRILENDGDLARLRREVDELIAEIRRRAGLPHREAVADVSQGS